MFNVIPTPHRPSALPTGLVPVFAIDIDIGDDPDVVGRLDIDHRLSTSMTICHVVVVHDHAYGPTIDLAQRALHQSHAEKVPHPPSRISQ